MARSQNSIAVLMRITAFRRMWLALSTSSLGDWLGLLATTAMAAYLTKNSSNFAQGAAVSGVLVFRLLPDLVLGPIAGALVDRLDRRYVAMIGDTLAGLMYLSIPLVGNLGWLLAAQFLVEAVGLFSNPAKQALWVNIVPRERLAVANQLNYVSVYGMVPVAALVFALLATAAQFFGAPPVPAAGASTALISVTSSVAINIALIFDAATYFLAASVLFATRRLIPAYLDERPPPKSVFRLVREGVGYVKNSAVMRAIYVGILGAFAAGGLVAGVAQAYVATMGAGSAGYGILFGTVFTGLALGMLIGPKVLPAVPRRMVFTMAIGVAGLALVVMSVIQDFVGAAVMSVVMGLFAGIAWITGFTMIGHEVADRLRGRVFSFVMSSVRIMLLGTIAVGPVLANSIGYHSFSIGEYQLVFTGPGLVLLASGLVTIAVAIFSGRQVGGLPGELMRHLSRRLLRSRRRNLLDAEESDPGVLITVVGPDGDATARYAEALVAHLSGQGWVVCDDAAPVEPARPDDTESDALRALAKLSDLATHRLRPAIESGCVVVCRDYVDAAVVRFGAQARLGEEHIVRMADWSTGKLRPDLTVLVDPSLRPSAEYDDVPGESGDGAREVEGAASGETPAAGAEGEAVHEGADKSAEGTGESAEGAAGLGSDAGLPGEAVDVGVPAVDAPAVSALAEGALGSGGVSSGGLSADGPGDAEVPAVDPVRAYQDLAAAAPERYVVVPPLPSGGSLPEDLADHVRAVLAHRSPRRAGTGSDGNDGDTVIPDAGSATGADTRDDRGDGTRDEGRDDAGAGAAENGVIPEADSPDADADGGAVPDSRPLRVDGPLR
ncbi:MAG: hypothetical protein BGO26_00985 [Actinobacteria bacterium 69-20]|nr:MFS transporter [Actinomycetota bacterium]OJV28580.1 MAG: hypothetical protein BGO26_00985 [Actinobacteria bacterium 69-20]